MRNPIRLAIVVTALIILAAPLRAQTPDAVMSDFVKDITEVDMREVLIFAPLIAGTLILGVQPNLIFEVTNSSVNSLVAAYQTAIGGVQ